MARPKDDPLTASHYATAHYVGPFPKGTTVTAEELIATFGIPVNAAPEVAAKTRAASLKRLLDLGAITPAEAPEPEPADEPEPTAFTNPPTPTPKK